MATMPATGGLLDRAIRTAKLERAAYEEVEADQGATVQAGIVVAVGAIASAIGLAAASTAGAVPGTIGPNGAGAGGGLVSSVIGESITALIAWAAYAQVAFWVGTTVLKGPETHADWGQVARTLGFASAPRTLLILGVVPALFVPVSLVVAVWLLITTVVAVRAALDVGTGRAIAIAIASWFTLAIVSAVVGQLLGSFL